MKYVAVFVTQYNSSLSSFVQNFRIISEVVAEKSLTEKMAIILYIISERQKEKMKKNEKRRQNKD